MRSPNVPRARGRDLSIRVARRHRDDAEDVVQETFLKLLTHLFEAGARERTSAAGCSRSRRMPAGTPCAAGSGGCRGLRGERAIRGTRTTAGRGWPAPGSARCPAATRASRSASPHAQRRDCPIARSRISACRIRGSSVGRLLARAATRPGAGHPGPPPLFPHVTGDRHERLDDAQLQALVDDEATQMFVRMRHPARDARRGSRNGEQ